MKIKYRPKFYDFYEYFDDDKKIPYEILLTIINDEVEEKEELRKKIIDDVNLFYKWQLLKRNPDYRADVDTAKKNDGENYAFLSSGEASETWKISEFCDYYLEKPTDGFCFNLDRKLNFYNLDEYSFKDFFVDANKIHDITESDLREDHKIESNLDKIIESSIAGIIKDKLMIGSRVVPHEEDDDKRFCILAIDLKTSSSVDNVAGLTKHIQERIRQYGAIESSKQISPKRWKHTKYIERFDKGLLVYDYVIKNNGITDGLEKEISKITGKPQDQSTLRDTFSTYADYVNNVVQVFIQLDKA